MKQSKKLMALPLFYALMLTACNNNNSIPSSYIGFKNTQQTAYSGGYPFSISGDIRSVPS